VESVDLRSTGNLDAFDIFILLVPIRALACFALLWNAWFNTAFGEPVGPLSAAKKTVLVFYVHPLSLPANKLIEQGLTAALSSSHAWDLEVFSEYLVLARFPAARYGDGIVRYFPREATVLYRDPSLWDEHPRLIIATAATLVLQSLLIVGLVIQRSKWRRAENALRESEARFRMMADTAPVMVWMSGADMLCNFFNKPWLEFTGRTMEQELGNGWSEGVHAEDLQHCLETYVSSFKARRPFTMEYRLRRANGEYRWVLDTGVPRYSLESGFAGYIGSCLDITERKQAELQLQHQRDELAHLSRVTTLGEMTAALAHELNQPLGAIHSNAEAAQILLQKNPLDLDEVRAILSDIRQDGWRAGEVIHRMRSLLKRHRFKIELIEVKGLVGALGGLLQAVMISRKARLRIDVAPALPPVWGDTVQLQQVLLNLILNALDAMIDCPMGEREVVVRALPYAMGGVTVSVTDQGTGFCEEKLARLFEPFSTTKKHGMGIGLSICQTIIDAHGGQLTAENNSDRGATLRFTLPAPAGYKKENPA
jgi:PAS domain S-box-containing protein